MLTLQSKLIAAVAGLVILGLLMLGIAHHFESQGAETERAAWLKKEATERAADQALTLKHDAAMQALREQQQSIERKTSEHHEQELAALRAERDADRRRVDAAGGLRIPASTCAPGRTVAAAETAGTQRRDEPDGAASVRLPQPVENSLWALADGADEVSAQLRACQGWIRANGFYGHADSNDQLLDRIAVEKNFKEAQP